MYKEGNKVRSKRKNKNKDRLGNIIIMLVVFGLAWMAINVGFSQIDKRVCGQSSASEYTRLHCEELTR